MDNETRHWPITDKIDTHSHRGWNDWSEYLADTIEPARHALAALARATAELPDARQANELSILAVWEWLRRCGVESVEMHREEDQTLNLAWFYVDRPPNKLIPGHTGPARVLNPDEIKALGKARADLYQKAVDAEREWLTHAPDAPVIRAMCTGEEDVGGYIQPAQMDGERSYWEWDATASIIALDPEDRSSAMERDTYASDALRDADEADPEARDWDGPYKVEAIIHRPSAKLVAFREARNLHRLSPQVGASGVKRRI